MRRLVCVFVVSKPPADRFSRVEVHSISDICLNQGLSIERPWFNLRNQNIASGDNEAKHDMLYFVGLGL